LELKKLRSTENICSR